MVDQISLVWLDADPVDMELSRIIKALRDMSERDKKVGRIHHAAYMRRWRAKRKQSLQIK